MSITALSEWMHCQAALDAPGVRVRLVQYRGTRSCDVALVSDGSFRLELALSARHPSAQGCYPAHWPETRFQRIGEMFILAPGQKLRIRSEVCAPLDAVVCDIDRELFADMYSEYLGQNSAYPFKEGDSDLYLPASLDLQNSRIRALLVRIADETREPGIAGKVVVGALAVQLVVELLRVGAALGAPKTQGGLASWQLRLIDERLKELGAAPSLAELAALCHISVRHLTRAFKESRGFTIGSFVTQRHMDHAKKLLADGDSVTAIAMRLGFSSSSSFCATFGRENGLTPGEFRLKFLVPRPSARQQ